MNVAGISEGHEVMMRSVMIRSGMLRRMKFSFWWITLEPTACFNTNSTRDVGLEGEWILFAVLSCSCLYFASICSATRMLKGIFFKLLLSIVQENKIEKQFSTTAWGNVTVVGLKCFSVSYYWLRTAAKLAEPLSKHEKGDRKKTSTVRVRVVEGYSWFIAFSLLN